MSAPKKRGPKGRQYVRDDDVLLTAAYFEQQHGLARNAAIRKAVAYWEILERLPGRRRSKDRRNPKTGKLKLIPYRESKPKFLRRLYDRLAGKSLQEFATESDWRLEVRELRGHQLTPQHEALDQYRPPSAIGGPILTFIFVQKDQPKKLS
jgi:hypothetical protein